MIIKVNDKAIIFDVSASSQLTEELKTTNLAIPVNEIKSLRLHIYPSPVGEVVQIMLKDSNEINIQLSLITTINGTNTDTTNIQVFDRINLALFGI